MKFVLSLLLMLIIPGSASTQEHTWSFSSAKNKLQKKVYKDIQNPTTLYCGCSFTLADKKIDPTECGYIPKNDNIRAHRIEWEHIVPASHFGQWRYCWMQRKEKFKDQCQNKTNRQCCGKVDPEFRQMESDMHNLWPAIGELNAIRSNFEYDIIPEEARNYGKCDFEVMYYNSRFDEFSINMIEPPPAARGIIARAYKYMMNTYNIMTSCRTETLMDVWDHDFPPTPEECYRNLKILEIQGNDNPFITKKCTKG